MKEEALKLADELDALHQYVPSEAPDMIRRLVEELDKQEYRNELLENSIKFAMLANNLQDKQGEPVAYWDGKHFASKEKSSLADIPLYTTPQTKPLSDEEIMEIFKAYEQMQEYGYVGKKPFQVHLGWSLEDRNSCLMLARAIEERHGIK